MDNHQINQFSDSSNIIEDELQNGGNTLLNQTKNCNTIDKKLLAIKENIKNEKDYKIIIKGILNGMLFDENMSFDNYFHILYSINNDSYKNFLMNLEDVMSSAKLKVEKYDKIYKIFERLIKINVDNNDLSEILILICRNIYPGQNLLYSILSNNNINNNVNNSHNQNVNPNNEENYMNNYFYKFLIFIKSNLNYILENDINRNMPGIIFIKILRLLCETHIYHPIYKMNNSDNLSEAYITYNNNTMNLIANAHQKVGFNDSTKKLIAEIYDIQIYILTKLYQEKKEKIFQVGRDLIRLLISVGKSNIEIIKTIYTDLLTNDNYEKILNLPYPEPGYNIYAEINIPPLMESMILYILTAVKKSSGTYSYYINWLYREFKIENCFGNTILVDVARYILSNYARVRNSNMNDIVPSWLILGYIIKHMTNQIFSSELKHVLFMDLILFDKERDNFKLIEPSLLCIIINMKEFPAISEELIEFLSYYAKHFDDNEEKSKKRFNSIYEGFKMFEQKEHNNNINSIEKSIKESKMEENFKNVLINLIHNENMSNSNNKNKNKNNNNINKTISNNNNTSSLNQNQNNSINSNDQNINNLINNSNNNNNNQILLNQLNENDKSKNQIKKANKNNNKNNKQSSDNKIEINIEIIIPKEINTYIQTNILKNFLKDRKQKTFHYLLNDLCNYNIKTYGNSDSSIKCLDSSYQSLCQNFAEFFIKVFNDELEFKDFENLDFSPNKNEKNINYVYIYLFDFAYEKYEDNITF